MIEYFLFFFTFVDYRNVISFSKKNLLLTWSPTRRGKSHVVPPSGDNPIPEYEAAILAFEDAILASQARAKPSPPPAHAPFIAAMRGLRRPRKYVGDELKLGSLSGLPGLASRCLKDARGSRNSKRVIRSEQYRMALLHI